MHQKVVNTHNKIKHALIELINKRGIDHITVKDITEHAHINRSTFYKYFASKDELINYYEDMLLQEILNYFLKDKDLSPEKPNLYRVIYQVIHYIDKEFELSRALLGPNGDPLFEKKVYVLLIKAINFDVLRLSSNHQMYQYIPKEYIYEILISPLIGIIKKWLAQPHPEDPDEIFNIIMRMRYLSPYDLLNIPYQG